MKHRARLAIPAIVWGLVYLVLFVVLPPTSEVPQNDDWAYYLTIERWFEEGRLEHIGWNDPTLVFQLWWGALFAKVFGLGYSTLRISTLVLSWIGVVSVHGILRLLGVDRWQSMLAAGILLFNPLYLTLSYSFNTDVPYVALASAATCGYLLGSRRDSLGWLVFAGSLAACAFLVRQQGLLLAVVATIWATLETTGTRRRLLVGLTCFGPTLVAAVAHAIWLPAASGGEMSVGIGALSANPVGRSPAALVEQVAREGAGSLLTLALFCTPLALSAVAGRFRESSAGLRPRWLLGLAGGTAALIAVSYWLSAAQPAGLRGWPYQGNYLTRYGSLPAGPVDPLLPEWLWLIPTLAAPLLAAVLVGAVLVSLTGSRRAWRRPAGFVVIAGAAQLLPALALDTVYDRYVLVAIPAATVALGCVARSVPLGRWLATAILAMAALFSIEWTRVYTDRAEARWRLAETLVQRDVPPAQIDAGYEWAGAHLYLEARRVLGARPPYRLDEGYPWAPLVDPRYRVTDRKFGGPQSIAERTYAGFAFTERRVVGAYPVTP
jgi:4-amino-4-deoxy-L-arabinose transferase-like glycosyltransferase